MKRRRYVLIVDLGNDGMFIKDVVVRAVARRLPRPAASANGLIFSYEVGGGLREQEMLGKTRSHSRVPT